MGGTLGQLEPTCARRERGPDKSELLEETRKEGGRGVQRDREDGPGSPHRWEQEARGWRGQKEGVVWKESVAGARSGSRGEWSAEMDEAEETGWRLMEQ